MKLAILGGRNKRWCPKTRAEDMESAFKRFWHRLRRSGARLGLQRCLLRIFSHENEQIRVRLAQKLSQFASFAAALLAVPQQALGGYLGRQLCQLPSAVDKNCACGRFTTRPFFLNLCHHVSF